MHGATIKITLYLCCRLFHVFPLFILQDNRQIYIWESPTCKEGGKNSYNPILLCDSTKFKYSVALWTDMWKRYYVHVIICTEKAEGLNPLILPPIHVIFRNYVYVVKLPAIFWNKVLLRSSREVHLSRSVSWSQTLPTKCDLSASRINTPFSLRSILNKYKKNYDFIIYLKNWET